MLARLNAELAHPWGAEPPKSTKRECWVPGDPLYDWQHHYHELVEEHRLPIHEDCAPCPDAARWPEPLDAFEHNLDLLDDLMVGLTVEQWIADYHRHARKASQR